jgi:hypothetical protein
MASGAPDCQDLFPANPDVAGIGVSFHFVRDIEVSRALDLFKTEWQCWKYTNWGLESEIDSAEKHFCGNLDGLDKRKGKEADVRSGRGERSIPHSSK